ncbi:MAG: methionyl-tRNA formyltransferase [Chloroflexi bacterium CFX2]|nr:methionyl-tRNA formyltransferase [Chloroflexi bacterium CFX2]
MELRVVFMGSPDFALPALRLLAQTYRVVGVVTQPDRASGRGRELKAPPVKLLAQELIIPVIQPERLREPEAMAQLKAWNPDLIVVAAFGQILKKDVLELPQHGCINVHASLLPRWRGAAPINAAILAGDEETGVTIMKMDVGLDTGPMLAKRSLRIKPDDTTGSLIGALSTLGADLLIETLPGYIDGKVTLKPQPEDGVTYAPMLKKEDGRLDFEKPAVELERRIRAMNPWPGAWFEWNGAPLKVLKARTDILFTYMNQTPGNRLVSGNEPVVATSNGFLFLEEVQPPGKKQMSGKSFLAGARNWEGA